MKKHYIYIIGIAAFLLGLVTALASCENISEDERFLEVEGVTAQRVVLLEDYTGQACPNCPKAHEKAIELHEQYKENLIIVAMHAGPQAFPEPMGLKLLEGDEYANSFGVQSYPVGLINRRGGLKDYPSWQSAVYEEIQHESPMKLSVDASVVDNKLKIKTELFSLENLSGKLQLWITEDSIVGFQLLPNGGSDTQYIHNHVFRGTINGTWGEDVSLTLGEEKTMRHNDFELNATWKPENLSIVAFVYNNDGVLQAAQCKVNVNE